MAMLVCRAKVVGIAPLSFGKVIQAKKNTGEGDDDFEERTWRDRMHVDSDGELFLPPTTLKKGLEATAKYLSESVPGKRMATYTKHFKQGIMCIEPIRLGIKAKDVKGERLFVPSDGTPGGGKRVWRTFPTVPQWQGEVEICVVDPLLIDKPEKIHEYLNHMGTFNGLGRFRPERGGFYGRFVVEWFKTEKAKDLAA